MYNIVNRSLSHICLWVPDAITAKNNILSLEHSIVQHFLIQHISGPLVACICLDLTSQYFSGFIITDWAERYKVLIES